MYAKSEVWKKVYFWAKLNDWWLLLAFWQKVGKICLACLHTFQTFKAYAKNSFLFQKNTFYVTWKLSILSFHFVYRHSIWNATLLNVWTANLPNANQKTFPSDVGSVDLICYLQMKIHDLKCQKTLIDMRLMNFSYNILFVWGLACSLLPTIM